LPPQNDCQITASLRVETCFKGDSPRDAWGDQQHVPTEGKYSGRAIVHDLERTAKEMVTGLKARKISVNAWIKQCIDVWPGDSSNKYWTTLS